MSQISVNNLTFSYEGSYDTIFENVSFSVDTDWKLGFIGRNGKGKTTFLQLLRGVYEYEGNITASTAFDYFPYCLTAAQMEECGAELAQQMKPECESWKVICELDKLDVDAEALYRPFRTLSHGERTKVMLAVLFSGEHDFLLIDEPTNHLDMASRETVRNYLAGKKGFILVSHDRELLDACIDHVLVLNRSSIEVQSGNFTSWWENKQRQDTFARAENDKHRKEIRKLEKASRRTGQWAEQNERTKIGYDPKKEPDHANRAFIGEKTRKMQSRMKQIQGRIQREIAEKEGLLNDLENPVDLKIMPLRHEKETLISVRDYGLWYGNPGKELFSDLRFTLRRGERLFVNGRNGCGKSSLLHAVLAHAAGNTWQPEGGGGERGTLETASGLTVSYAGQDTSFLSGKITDFCRERALDESLFCAVLRQLAVEREQFSKPMEDFSEGQKKKVLLAASFLTPAHLYIWDEPLNYIDVFSRMQIEKLLLDAGPTMLVVEHDGRFREKIATGVVDL